MRIITIQNIQADQDYTWERVRVSIWSYVPLNSCTEYNALLTKMI